MCWTTPHVKANSITIIHIVYSVGIYARKNQDMRIYGQILPFVCCCRFSCGNRKRNTKKEGNLVDGE
jgi:hypothetical protein